MGIIGEFKAFALRGNVVDMAVGIIIGTAFGKIVSSLVNDVLMPPIGKLLGNADFSNLFVALDEGEYASLAAAQEAGAATLNYGMFINTLIDFVLVALAVFAVIKAMNVAKRRKEEEPPPPKPAEQSSEEKLLTEIRDLLAAQA